MRKTIIGSLLALVLFAMPAFTLTSPQDAASKTKSAAKTAATKTEDAAKTVGTKTKDAAVETKNKVSGKMLDINTATKEQLMALPGVGDKYSDAIIKHRPYTMKNQIVSNAGVPQSTYDKIKDQIVAHKTPEQKAEKKAEKAEKKAESKK